MNKYEKTSMYWHILAARLAFVVVFEVSFGREETDMFSFVEQKLISLVVSVAVGKLRNVLLAQGI
jgi:hypothetical protein